MNDQDGDGLRQRCQHGDVEGQQPPAWESSQVETSLLSQQSEPGNPSQCWQAMPSLPPPFPNTPPSASAPGGGGGCPMAQREPSGKPGGGNPNKHSHQGDDQHGDEHLLGWLWGGNRGWWGWGCR